jgi:putative phosphoesterase
MKHKIALLSDIHGNLTALEAVVDDLKSEQATEIWQLGDLLMFGQGRQEILNLLSKLPVAVNIRGNWDDLFLEVADKTLPLEDSGDIYIARLGMYVLENLDTTDIEQIKNYPLTAQREINGITFNISHHLPNQNWGRGLLPAGQQADFDRLFEQKKADVAIYGHIHHQLMRYSSSEQLIINPGSVGNPYQNWSTFSKDLRAQYALITVDETGISDVKFKKIAYDVEKEISRAIKNEHPYSELYAESIRLGVVHTHDEDFMRSVNEKYGYEEEVRKFFRV